MKIVWTYRAELTFEAEQNFILKKCNVNEVINFIEFVEENLEKLKAFPLLGKPVRNNERSIVISKQTTLFYRILDNKTIELLLFWNNKWKPKFLQILLEL